MRPRVGAVFDAKCRARTALVGVQRHDPALARTYQAMVRQRAIVRELGEHDRHAAPDGRVLVQRVLGAQEKPLVIPGRSQDTTCAP